MRMCDSDCGSDSASMHKSQIFLFLTQIEREKEGRGWRGKVCVRHTSLFVWHISWKLEPRTHSRMICKSGRSVITPLLE